MENPFAKLFKNKEADTVPDKPQHLYATEDDTPLRQIVKNPFELHNNDEQGGQINSCYISLKWQAREQATIKNAADDDQYYVDLIAMAKEDLLAQMYGPDGHAANILGIEAKEEAFFREIVSNEEDTLSDLMRAYREYEALCASWL